MKKQFPLILLLLLLIPTITFAQRLPSTVRPDHYEIWLNPDLRTNRLQGKESISVDLKTRMQSILLHTVDLSITRAEFISDEKRWKATPLIQKETEIVELKFPSALPSGSGKLEIEFEGKLRNDLRGLYAIETSYGRYAATQFEGTYARMMIPCFDEPEFKATFDLTVVADKNHTAISNGKIETDSPGPGADKHTIRFARSPKMSTYLLAVAIGDLQCVQDSVDEVPIRVCAPAGKEKLGNFALKAAAHFLYFYNGWYGIPYPFGKLDMVAVPDYEWGGMENTASIFYRDSALLIDEKTASVAAKRRVASVVSHELAHQWFGDLVTMKWWDNIWLNEGFATWITFKPLQAWDPNWDQSEEESLWTTDALAVDSLSATRPIRAKAETPGEINEMFDGIAYGKAAAVLRMVEAYTGPASFQKAVNSYVAKYANGNSTAEDFCSEVAEESKKPVDQIMLSYIDQPGAPLVTAMQSCSSGKGELVLRQQRFFDNAGKMKSESPELWQIPVCMRWLDAPGNRKCELLRERTRTVAIERCEALVINAGGRGYYRAAYDSQTFAKIAASAQTALTSAELIALLNDQWSLVKIGRVEIGNYMKLAEALQNNTNRAVMEIVMPQLQEIDRHLISQADGASYHRWFTAWLKSVQQQLGAEAKEGETDDHKALRASVFQAIGNLGDPDAIATANDLLVKFTKNPDLVDPSMVSAAFRVAASHGDKRLYEDFLSHLKTASSPEIYLRYLYALASFNDAELTRRSTDFAMSREMRGQETPAFFGWLLEGENRKIVWSFMKQNWPSLQKKVVSFGGGPAIQALGNACDTAFRDDVTDFFKKNRAPAAERSVKQAIENIDNCIAFRDLQQSKMQEWLQQNGNPR